ncbi:MAG: hypothetical protein Q9213_002219 [Squamulea squamosa]
MGVQELTRHQDLAETNSVVLCTAGQRWYGKAMVQMKDWLPSIGQVSYIEAKLKICVSDLGEGWRAQSALAGGGAMADVGWHLLDMVIELANVNQKSVPTVDYARLFYVRSAQGHDCEDSAQVIIGLPSRDMTAHLTVSRIGHEEKEETIITGEKGTLTFDGNTVLLHFSAAAREESLRYDPRQDADHNPDVERMFANFYDLVQATRTGVSLAAHPEYSKYRIQDMIVTRTLQAIYQYISDKNIRQHQSHAGLLSNLERAKTPDLLQELAMIWPIVDKTLEAAVTAQLHKEISIYGNGGVFRQIESEFKDFHGASSSYALLHNSGTNALHALYFAAGFKFGDEVIFPVYTFHATCSPAMHFGIKPVFCDASENGNISPDAIAQAITSKTKAVVVTHMWGIPCDMAAIVRY